MSDDNEVRIDDILETLSIENKDSANNDVDNNLAEDEVNKDTINEEVENEEGDSEVIEKTDKEEDETKTDDEVEDDVESSDEETVDSLKERNELLLKRIEELTNVGGIVPAKGDETKGDETKANDIPAEIKQAVKISDEGVVDFVGESDIDEILENKDKLNMLLTTVCQSAIQQADKKVYERVLSTLPEIVTGHVSRQAIIGDLVKEFYDNNPDLIAVRKTVGAVANDIHAKEPELKVEEVFEKAAVTTRKILGMKIPKKKAAKAENFENPSFVNKGKGGRVKSEKTKSLQDDINDLFNIG